MHQFRQRRFLLNAVSADSGIDTSILDAFNSFTAGIISSISSFPNLPPSPACGFSPRREILGFSILNFSFSS